jgi:GGDEF domain-containing protein
MKKIKNWGRRGNYKHRLTGEEFAIIFHITLNNGA